MPKCSFCGKDYNLNKGLTLVDALGKIRHFCSSKCRKNMKAGGKKRKWALKPEKS